MLLERLPLVRQLVNVVFKVARSRYVHPSLARRGSWVNCRGCMHYKRQGDLLVRISLMNVARLESWKVSRSHILCDGRWHRR